ncbi:hypothetical protein CERZMDRAFT_84925 [Cercospora zeae-maydis SCOH1-5]|uniref:ARB-07466-like C-terminal domain-containing protein n=1 Tax=Cercospora zeae-maydis SCOH1-5 TaxID=717836 RepID=A0A6A6FF26_9PEZI|nr:hypothetical protein CERZMDRAFT_84925 [Cercospora zeae-maydis SCOH1-5]
MRSPFILVAALAAAVSAAVNDPCYGPNGIAGVCIDTGACTNSGGSSIAGACPADPANVRCCSKTRCNNGSAGNCRWRSDCDGSSVTGQCPGPAQMQCCSSSAQGWGGYNRPAVPAVGACRQVAVNGANRVINEFPGRIRQIFCIRDCACGSGSDHCCGKAIDYMLSDGGGQASISGRQIAEWAMNNRGVLNLSYVIWGQRIWSAGRDSVTGWNNWRSQNDRGSITANHWDHVHISFN